MGVPISKTHESSEEGACRRRKGFAKGETRSSGGNRRIQGSIKLIGPSPAGISPTKDNGGNPWFAMPNVQAPSKGLDSTSSIPKVVLDLLSERLRQVQLPDGTGSPGIIEIGISSVKGFPELADITSNYQDIVSMLRDILSNCGGVEQQFTTLTIITQRVRGHRSFEHATGAALAILLGDGYEVTFTGRTKAGGMRKKSPISVTGDGTYL